MAKEIDLSGVNLGGGKRGVVGAPDTPPASVNGDVYVSESKPYTYRLNIALQKRLAAYCARTGRGKGPVVDAAIEQWLDAHEGDGA